MADLKIYDVLSRILSLLQPQNSIFLYDLGMFWYFIIFDTHMSLGQGISYQARFKQARRINYWNSKPRKMWFDYYGNSWTWWRKKINLRFCIRLYCPSFLDSNNGLPKSLTQIVNFNKKFVVWLSRQVFIIQMGVSDVGDNVMLNHCWWLTDGDGVWILVTEFWCWWHLLDVGVANFRR